MKTVTLHIEDEVINDLDAHLRQKRLDGRFSGVSDMLGLAVLEATKANQPERTIRYRKRDKAINAVGK